jgi:hypothetical protein
MTKRTKRAAKLLPLDRREVMRDAHRRFKDCQRLRLDFTFADCLSSSWTAARMRRAGTHRSWDNRRVETGEGARH